MAHPLISRWLAAAMLVACTGSGGSSDRTPPVLDTGDSDCEEPATWFEDFDLDGFGNADSSREACVQPPGWVADASDCDDEDDGTYPGAIEACDGVDRDCNGLIDDADYDAPRWHPDEDGDGYGNDSAVVRSCSRPADHQPAHRGTDCDDADPDIHPNAADAPCDGIDQDCSGEPEPGLAQIGGRTYAHAQLAMLDATADAPVHLCEGDHRVQVSLEHDLVLIGVGERERIRVLPLGDERMLHVAADRLELRNLSFEGGRGRGDGGAVLAEVRALQVEDVAFIGNHALLRGGGLHAELADAEDFVATLSQVQAHSNHAGRSGGALSISMHKTGFVTVEDAVLVGNSAGKDGGAVWVEGTDTTQVLAALNITARNNHAAGRGGTLALVGKRNAILRGRSIDIRGGSASEGGLIALTAPDDGKIDLAECTLHDGRASIAGGLVHHSGRFTLDNTLALCDLSRGRAPIGGLQWLQTGTTAHLSWDDVDLHHGQADVGAAIYLTGTAAPFSGALSRVELRDTTGGPAFEVDPDYPSESGLLLELTDGVLVRNAGGGVSVPRGFEVELSDVDSGSGADDNGGFDVRQGGSPFSWEGPVSILCSDGSCS